MPPPRAYGFNVNDSPKAIVEAARRRRWVSSLPIGDVIAALAAFATVATVGASIVGGSASGNLMMYFYVSLAVAVLCLGVLVTMVWVKTNTECQRRMYDPASIAFLQTAFDQLDTDDN